MLKLKLPDGRTIEGSAAEIAQLLSAVPAAPAPRQGDLFEDDDPPVSQAAPHDAEPWWHRTPRTARDATLFRAVRMLEILVQNPKGVRSDRLRRVLRVKARGLGGPRAALIKLLRDHGLINGKRADAESVLNYRPGRGGGRWQPGPSAAAALSALRQLPDDFS